MRLKHVMKLRQCEAERQFKRTADGGLDTGYPRVYAGNQVIRFKHKLR